MAKLLVLSLLLMSAALLATVQTVVAADDKCKSEGLFPSTHDCKTFYRCQLNGDGSFRKYDFECGPGTVFDPDLDTCNNPWALDPSSPCHLGQAGVSAGECTGEGFFPNPTDCSKFYRCVDLTGDGKFTKFDFDCGPGTVFDPDLNVCNHPWAIDPSNPCFHDRTAQQ